MGAGASLAHLAGCDAAQLGELVAQQARQHHARTTQKYPDGVTLAQGKAFADCKSMFVDFGLDGDTVLELGRKDR